MALMLIGFSESIFSAFNYVFGIKSILRIRKDYLICCLFFLATIVAGTLLELFLVAATEGSLGARMIAFCITTFIELYL